MVDLKRFIAYVFLIILVFSVTGCRTIKAPSDPYETWVPPSWEKTSTSKDTVWESIRQREIDPSKPLVLFELVDIAIGNNPTTRQAWANSRAAEARVKQAQSEWYPQIEISAKGASQKKETDQDLTDTDNIYARPGGEITFLLLDLGGRNARIRGAMQDIIEANFQFNRAIQDLILDTETAYFDLYSAHSEVEAATADLEDAGTAFYTAGERHKVGLVSKLDVLQSESSYDQALYYLEEARGNVRTAKARLAQELGLPADAMLEIASPSQEVPTDLPEENVSLLIEEALMERPDIAAVRAALQSKEEAIRVANSDIWPSLSIGGSGDAGWYQYFGKQKSTLNRKYGHDYEYSGYFNISWDIFDGFKNINIKREAQFEMEQEREKLKQSELEASADVWIKYYNLKTAGKKFVFSKAFLKSATASHELAVVGYRTGLKDILDLLQAQSQLSDARSKLIESRKELYISLAELIHATGMLYVVEEQ